MLEIIVLLYLVSIKIAYSDITKNEKEIFRKLKIDGYNIIEEGKIKKKFKILRLIPILNLYTASFLKNNFDFTYKEFKKIFIKKQLISETPILFYVNNEIKKLEKHVYNIIKDDDIIHKIKYLEKRKKSDDTHDNMNLDIQDEFINTLISNEKNTIFSKEQQKTSKKEQILFLNNLKKLASDNDDFQKIKQ